MTHKFHAVAVDGPSGAGKSTLAKAAAKELHFCYVDTGAIYRSIGWFALSKQVDPENAAAVAAILPDLRLSMHYDDDGLQHMTVNDVDITDEIRKPKISAAASRVAAHGSVREYLLEMQRVFAREHDVIMDGRDIGTVVLPDADCKVFLTASPEVRAQRRCLELEQRGTPECYEEVLRDMRLRDETDRNRAVAPLKQAVDAVLLDTSKLSFEKSQEKLIQIIREKLLYEA